LITPVRTGPRIAAALENLARTVRCGILAGLFLMLLWLVADVCLIVFAAVLLACVLRGLAVRLAAILRITPGWALGMILMVLLLTIALLIWWRGSAMLTEASQLRLQLAGQIEGVRERIQAIDWGRDALDRLGSYLSDSGGQIAGTMAGFATTTLGILGSTLVLLITALYLTASPDLYVSGTLRLLPPPMRGRGRVVLRATGDALRWWSCGQAIDMVVVGGLTWAGLALLGVPLAASLALVAALCNFVPFIGALAGALPAVLIAFGQGVNQAMWVAALFFVVQALEGNVIAPLIQRRTVRLPPALTILSQTVLGSLFGVMGLILATPLATAVMVITRMVYVESVLEGEPNDQADRIKKNASPNSA
jgi:predicted PurR-regulated permease PerM